MDDVKNGVPSAAEKPNLIEQRFVGADETINVTMHVQMATHALTNGKFLAYIKGAQDHQQFLAAIGDTADAAIAEYWSDLDYANVVWVSGPAFARGDVEFIE